MQLMLINKYNARAQAAYWRSEGEGAPIPKGESDLYAADDGKYYVVLSNGDGILAVFRVRNDDMLKRLKRWPAELNVNYRT